MVAETVGGPSLFVTVDGAAYKPLELSDPLAIARSVDAGVAGIAVTGLTGATHGDGFVAHGATISQVTLLDAPTMRGTRLHEPFQVIVRENELLVLGAINRAPVVWPVMLAS